MTPGKLWTTHVISLPTLKPQLTPPCVSVLHKVEPMKWILETTEVRTPIFGLNIKFPQEAYLSRDETNLSRMSKLSISFSVPEDHLRKSVHLHCQAPISVSRQTFRQSNIKTFSPSVNIAPNRPATNVSAYRASYSVTSQLGTLRSILISAARVPLVVSNLR